MCGLCLVSCCCWEKTDWDDDWNDRNDSFLTVTTHNFRCVPLFPPERLFTCTHHIEQDFCFVSLWQLSLKVGHSNVLFLIHFAISRRKVHLSRNQRGLLLSRFYCVGTKKISEDRIFLWKLTTFIYLVDRKSQLKWGHLLLCKDKYGTCTPSFSHLRKKWFIGDDSFFCWWVNNLVWFCLSRKTRQNPPNKYFWWENVFCGMKKTSWLGEKWDNKKDYFSMMCVICHRKNIFDSENATRADEFFLWGDPRTLKGKDITAVLVGTASIFCNKILS